MAVSQDEWNGELTRFLDKLPFRPCIVPPAPSFCTLCGRLDHPVASACKFYPLRFEREMGRTSVEPPSLMSRRDTFEIDIGFDEEEEEQELPEAPMIEFERPQRATVAAVAPVAKRVPDDEAEVEVVEVELVEVVEEPGEETEEEPVGKELEKEMLPEKGETDDLKEDLQSRIKEEIEKELVDEGKPSEGRDQADVKREAWELDEDEEARLLQKAPEEIGPEPKTAMGPVEPSKKLKRILKAAKVAKEGGDKPAMAIAIKQPEAGPVKEEQPIPHESMTVIAPIYPQPKLKIIDGDRPPARSDRMPLPPPPPDYIGPMPANAPSAETQPSDGTVAPQTAPAISEEPERTPDAPAPKPPIAEETAGKPEKPGPIEKAPEAPAPSAPQPATGRRTGGLYDIFRRKPPETKKEAPKPEKDKGNDKKKEDEELLKRLKSIEK